MVLWSDPGKASSVQELTRQKRIASMLQKASSTLSYNRDTSSVTNSVKLCGQLLSVTGCTTGQTVAYNRVLFG